MCIVGDIIGILLRGSGIFRDDSGSDVVHAGDKPHPSIGNVDCICDQRHALFRRHSIKKPLRFTKLTEKRLNSCRRQCVQNVLCHIRLDCGLGHRSSFMEERNEGGLLGAFVGFIAAGRGLDRH